MITRASRKRNPKKIIKDRPRTNLDVFSETPDKMVVIKELMERERLAKQAFKMRALMDQFAH